MRTTFHPTRARALAETLRIPALALLVLALEAIPRGAIATDAPIVIPTRQEAARVNNDTVGVVFTHEELFHQLVHNLEDALEPVSGLRIVPVMGKNHVQSIYDLLYLKGVDLALVRADAVEYVKRKGDYDRIELFVNSVAKLTDERLVLIANNRYKTVDDLAGETVAFGVPGSGEYVTGTIAFENMGIEVNAVEMDGTLALNEVSEGNIAAMVYLLRARESIQTGSDLQTARAVARIEDSANLHVVPIPSSDAMDDIYHAYELGHDELPGLIPEGETVQSYLVDVILAAYRWNQDNPRYVKSVRFVNALLDGLDSLKQGEFQMAWNEVYLPQAEPTVEPLPVVGSILAEREQLAAERAAIEAEEAEQAALVERQRKTAEFVATRDRLGALLDQKINDDDTDELQKMLDELNSILDETETDAAAEIDTEKAGKPGS